MKINSARFVKGITGTDNILYDGRTQIAFMGRSNAGKSTMINSLTGKKNLVRTSAHPGQTIRMDFFLINDKFYFVDFPGYGFARAGADRREKLRKMILWYLLYSNVPKRAVVLITDANVGITEFDRQALETLIDEKIEHIIIANKIDKLKKHERDTCILKYKEEYPYSRIIAYSSKEITGRNELLEALNLYI